MQSCLQIINNTKDKIMSNNTVSENYLFTLTAFDQEGDRVATPLVLANSALANGKDVLLWLTMEGVELAKQGAAETVNSKSFAPVSELLEIYIENGGRIGVCPPCAKTHGVTENNIIGQAELMGAVAMLDETVGRQTFSF
jgi:predicted peroxiredoxin